MKPDATDQVVTVADEVSQLNQVIQLVKENKIATAVMLFFAWQTGLLLSAYEYAQGGVC